MSATLTNVQPGDTLYLEVGALVLKLAASMVVILLGIAPLGVAAARLMYEPHRVAEPIR